MQSFFSVILLVAFLASASAKLTSEDWEDYITAEGEVSSQSVDVA